MKVFSLFTVTGQKCFYIAKESRALYNKCREVLWVANIRIITCDTLKGVLNGYALYCGPLLQ